MGTLEILSIIIMLLPGQARLLSQTNQKERSWGVNKSDVLLPDPLHHVFPDDPATVCARATARGRIDSRVPDAGAWP